MNRYLVVGMSVLAAAASFAGADTIATFADPAMSGATPLFELDGNTLSGSWSGTGLTLMTPGLSAPDFTDVTFTMSAVNLTGTLPFSATGPGSIDFFDSSNNPLFTISFDSASLASPFAFGASEFAAQNVVFSGPIIDIPLAGEQFAFSFANPVTTQNGFTVTASFTSSAVPAPASAALFGLAGLVAGRRRR